MAAGDANDPAKILSDMLAAGQDLMRKLGAATGTAAGTDGSADLLAAAKQAAELQQQAFKQAAELWSGMLAAQTGGEDAGAKAADKRFAGEPWRNDPRFDAVRK